MGETRKHHRSRESKNRSLPPPPKPIAFDNLVIEGGGVLGIAYIGVLRELYRDGSILKCKNFVGSSIGSIVALMLAIRTPFETIDNIMRTLNLKEFKDNTWILGDLTRLLVNYGFYKGDKFLSFVQDTLKTVTDNPNITFDEVFKRYGTNLVITGTNVSKGNLVYFCKETHPTMAIALAARISGSVPYFFKSVKFNGDYYVDGGILNNYPISYYDNTATSIQGKTLGLKLISKADLLGEKGMMPPITNIKDFSNNLINCVLNQALKIHVKPEDWERTVRIFTGDLSYINFNLTEKEKETLIAEGLRAITDYKLSMAKLGSEAT